MPSADRLRALLIATAILSLSALTGGCGSSSASGSASGSTPISRRAYIHKVDVICEQGHRAALASEPRIERELGPEAGEATVVATVIRNGFLPAIARTMRSVEEVPPPDDMRRKVASLLTESDAAHKVVATHRITTLGRFEAIYHHAGRTARRAGLGACAFG